MRRFSLCERRTFVLQWDGLWDVPSVQHCALNETELLFWGALWVFEHFSEVFLPFLNLRLTY